MVRPRINRFISFKPGVDYFKPAGIPMRHLKEVSLSFEELEAIRLKDWEELEQEDCAKRMKISRPTFRRVLKSARKRVAEAFLHGKALRIEGGNYEYGKWRYRCQAGHFWNDNAARGTDENTCPVCTTVSKAI
jgi:predicted DNA-binding protein (UPF0251 family)